MVIGPTYAGLVFGSGLGRGPGYLSRPVYGCSCVYIKVCTSCWTDTSRGGHSNTGLLFFFGGGGGGLEISNPDSPKWRTVAHYSVPPPQRSLCSDPICTVFRAVTVQTLPVAV